MHSSTPQIQQTGESMKKHITTIAALAVGQSVGWLSHNALAKPQILPRSIGSGVAIDGDAKVRCVSSDISFVKRMNEMTMRGDGMVAVNR